MKQLLLFLSLLCALGLNAASSIRAVNNGRWSQTSTWNLNRLPHDGDTVFILANIQVVLDVNESLNDVVVRIGGTLRLNNGKLDLNGTSRVEVGALGRLSGTGNNDQVKIGNVFKFRGGVDLSILGPAYADESTGSSPNGFAGGLVILNYTDSPRVSRPNTITPLNVYGTKYGSTGVVTVKFASAQVDPVTITVMDLNGQTVARQQHQSRLKTMQVQVNNARPGTYLVLVDNNGRKEIRKVVF